MNKFTHLITKFLFVLLFACSCVQISAAETGSVNIGYCDDNIIGGVGMSSKAVVSVAIYITPEQAKVYNGKKIDKIKVGVNAAVTNLSVFVSENLSAASITTQEIGQGTKGWNETSLDTPYTISDKGFYIGYTATGTYQCGIGDVPSPNDMYAAVNGQWSTLSKSDFNALSIYGVVSGENLPYDMSILSLDKIITQINTPSKLVGKVKNISTTAISNFEVTYKIGDNTPVIAIVNQNIAANTSAAFELDIPASEAPGDYLLNVTISKVNGIADSYAANSTKDISFKNKEFNYTRKVVVEEGTGTWCGWCPRGIIGLKEMKAKYPDTFIGIAIHSGDAFSSTNYNTILSKYFSQGLPNCVVNRNSDYVMDPDLSNLEKVYAIESRNGADAEIKMSAEYTDTSLKSLVVKTTSKFGFDSDAAAYRIAYVVLENGLSASQTNYYAGGGYGEMGGFEKLASKVAIDLNEVGRDILPSYTGKMNSVPTTIVKNQPYEYEYTLTLPSSIKNINNVEIVVLLLNSATSEIMNADKIELTSLSSVSEIKDSSNEINIYAVDNKIKVDSDYTQLEIYTLNGTQVQNTNLPQGIYIVKVIASEKVYTKKVVVK